eukprot:7391626-Prymnesium_polylepis.3
MLASEVTLRRLEGEPPGRAAVADVKVQYSRRTDGAPYHSLSLSNSTTQHENEPCDQRVREGSADTQPLNLLRDASTRAAQAAESKSNHKASGGIHAEQQRADCVPPRHGSATVCAALRLLRGELSLDRCVELQVLARR